MSDTSMGPGWWLASDGRWYPPAQASAPPPGPNSSRGEMYEYKVMTQKDRYFSGKFNPEQLQSALNSYAAEGWRVVGMATGQIAQGLGNREELIFLLERAKQ